MGPVSNLQPPAKPNKTVAGFPLHPACDAWPELSPTELSALADDIAAHGLQDAVTLELLPNEL